MGDTQLFGLPKHGWVGYEMHKSPASVYSLASESIHEESHTVIVKIMHIWLKEPEFI